MFDGYYVGRTENDLPDSHCRPLSPLCCSGDQVGIRHSGGCSGTFPYLNLS